MVKWYKDGFSFDEQIIESAYKVRTSGLYRIEEWGFRNGTPYLIYDYIDGVSSDKVGRMPVAVALLALRQVVKTLMELQKLGVSHGDLSPANVVFTASKGLQAVLIDCGIVGPGALAYAAPERFQGKRPDEKSDLFSLGLLLYRWIAGEELVHADGYEQFAEQMANVQNLNISEKLYSTGFFDSADGALQLSDASERVEDLDELDELLEIALNKVSGGDVALAFCVSQFVDAKNLRNVALKVPDSIENGLPFVVQKKNKWLKCSVFGVLLFILILIALLFTSGTMSFGIDATGDLLLKRSRTLESSSEVEKAPNLKVDSLLLDLPVPTVK